MRHVTAADFKATCLKLMDDVDQRGESIIITKRGRPVARLVPIERPDDVGRPLGQGRGTGLILGDLVEPVLAEDEWDANL
jgi:prevent-host-death family protein